MEKRIIKKILAVLLVIMLISTDFVVLGSNIVSYAVETSSNLTNNKNIEFSTYFKNSKGEKVDTLQTSIKSDNMKLYAEIIVKNEGYLSNAILKLSDSNFKIKDNILSDSIASIADNNVTLKQINAGETVTIELDIEPSIGDVLTEEMLLKKSTLELTGKYMETSYKGLNIEGERTVTLDLKVDEGASAELETDIITNKVFSIDGTNKRVVQLLVKSRLSDNQYPIKQTNINIDIPKLSEKEPEKIEVVSLGTNATNGKKSISSSEWKQENEKINIILKNEDNNIKWNKDCYDELVVTYIYEDDVIADIIEINSNSEIKVHNSEKTYTATYKKGIENKELNGFIRTSSEINGKGIYKEQIVSNTNVEYNTKTILEITNANIAEKVNITEIPDVLTTENEEMLISTKYISTKINKNSLLEIIGQEGNISIKSNSETITINKDSEANENGDIIIKYQNPTNELNITTSKIQKAGILEIDHTKSISDNNYTSDQLQNVKMLKTKKMINGTITLNDIEQTVIETASEANLEVKDSITKAEFIVNKETLSTMTTNQNVVLGVKLITDGVQYDLYKNPTIKIQLPSSVETININSVKPLYAEDFVVNSNYDSVNKIIEIKLSGEQNVRPESEATQLYLQLNLDITLSKLEPSKLDKIIMTYTNENAKQYDNGSTEKGIIEKEIGISAPSGLITMHNENTFNIQGIKGIDQEKQMVQIHNEDSGKELKFDIALVNNTGKDIENVRILGKLPTSGNNVADEENDNTLETTLENVIAENATIYYSENANATSDIENTANGWTTTLLQNAKIFLIVLDKINIESNFIGSYKVKLPTTLPKDVMSYSQYEVIYNTDIDKNIKEESVAIGFVTPTEVKLETEISAKIGNDKVNNGDTIKAGETIEYTMTLKNSGVQKLENIEVKSNIPKGTVFVTPEQDYQYSGTTYYTENTEITEVKEIIEKLEPGETYTKTYEVRVKSDIKEEKQITNKTIATCGETIIESSELTNKVQPANIRVTIKKLVDESSILIPGGTMEYMVIVENLSDKDIKDVKLQFVGENFELSCVSSGYDIYLIEDEIPDIIEIEKIPANGNVWYKFEGDSTVNADKVCGTAIVKDSDGNTYRSNKIQDQLQKVDAKISLTSPQNKSYIKEGDVIEYNIEVENTGDVKTVVEVIDNIPEYLEIQEVYVNGEIVLQSTKTAEEDTYESEIMNDLSYDIELEKGNKATMKIIAVVKNVTENIQAKTITNKVEVAIDGDTKSTSEEVTHILKITSENIKNVINGKAWLDKNLNGAKDHDEDTLSDIKVKIYDVSTNDYLKNADGEIIETTTDENGEYSFTKIPNGEYIILFEYDINEYETTYYMKDGVDDSINSKVVQKNVTINGEEKTYGVTDTIKLEDSISNINIGLKEKLIFDLQLDKYISRISIQNSKGTKTYDYENSTFEKVEIHRKQIVGSVVVLEYTIKVRNNGEIIGYAKNVKDYLTSGLSFNSELNPDWYLSGNELYTKKFANEPINPGEEKEVKLILTKTMTNENTGVVNNRAEIAEDYNEYGNSDVNSIPNNNISGENDLGSADVIIGISTGGTIMAYIILVIVNTILIAIAVKLMIKNKIIRIKRERR